MHRQKGSREEAAFVISVVTDAASQGVLMAGVDAVNRSCKEAWKPITNAVCAAMTAAAVLGIAAIRAAKSTTRL